MSSLCLSCGLCCDGTIFDVVPLTENESRTLTRLGLPIIQRATGPAMPQPCEALEGYHCQIYQQRPTPCRQFRCGLLDALAADEVSLSECLEHVDATRGLLAALAEALGALPAYEPTRPKVPGAADDDPDEHAWSGPIPGARRALRRRFDARLDAAVSAVERHLDEHFRGRARR